MQRVSIDRTDTLLQGDGRVEDAPIDAAFLAGQTGGDGHLQRDLLTLFVKQSAAIARRLDEPHLSVQKLRDELHLLKGSARAIGAGAVAGAAEAAEQRLVHRTHPELETLELNGLQDAIAEACSFAATLALRI